MGNRLELAFAAGVTAWSRIVCSRLPGVFIPLRCAVIVLDCRPDSSPVVMPDIYLEEWAAKKAVHTRTAQHWAKKGKIPAKIKRATVLVERTVRKYVVDENTPIPE